jgi:hypothetical protein
MASGKIMTEGAAAGKEQRNAPEPDAVALDSDEARLDAILHDPYGYSVRIREKYDVEAATWVKAEVERRIILERRQRREHARSFARWLLRRRNEQETLDPPDGTVTNS